ncbi:MAG TPA: MG2 domain-containing protein, partial [Bryobacteraceae bacterium]|nr:MG2 domain-containing protein [Bryobacteraceae bacterium]
MRRFLPLAMLLVGSLAAPVRAQVSLDESLTQATLVHTQTTVSLAFQNTLKKPVDAVMRLEWLDPSDRVAASAGQSSYIAPATSRISIALPLPVTKADARLLRLRYSVIPGMRNLGAFAPLAGILSLVRIAPYAFSLEILAPREARPGGHLELRILAANPATGEPVANVRVEAGRATATTGKEGLAVLTLSLPDDYAGDEIPLSAHLGDFTQMTEVSGLNVTRGDIRIQIDKPLYQPGQTLHIRTLALGPDGRARPAEKQKIRVLDVDGNLAHAADVTSSRYGISWTDWTIPVNAKAGKYSIEVSSADHDNPFERE